MTMYDILHKTWPAPLSGWTVEACSFNTPIAAGARVIPYAHVSDADIRAAEAAGLVERRRICEYAAYSDRHFLTERGAAVLRSL